MWSTRHGFDQHVYQSVYLVERNTKLYQMLAKEHITVFSTSFVSSSIILSFSVLSSEESEEVPFASDGICTTGLKCFIVMSGFRYLPLAKCKHYIQASAPRPCITMTDAESRPRPHLWRLKKASVQADEGRFGEEQQVQHEKANASLPESTLDVARYCNFQQERHVTPSLLYIFWKKWDVISGSHLCYGLAPLWMSSAVKTFCSDGKQIVWK